MEKSEGAQVQVREGAASAAVILVEALIAVLIVVAGFEYDQWRRRANNFTVYERFAVLFIFAVAVYATMYALFHRRLSLFGVTYKAPIYSGG